MNNRPKSEARWNALPTQLRQMRDGLDRSLAEAQRRFEAAPDEPFSARAVQLLVANAQIRSGDSGGYLQHSVPAELMFTSDSNASLNPVWFGPDAWLAEDVGLRRDGEYLCDIVGWHPSVQAGELITDVDSTSVDTRNLRWTRLPVDVREVSDAGPIVVDVWATSNELATRQHRMVHESTIRWDACLSVAGSAVPDCAAAYMTSSDFVDCSDEAVEALLRN